jgi:hypothetical protein
MGELNLLTRSTEAEVESGDTPRRHLPGRLDVEADPVALQAEANMPV